MQANALRDQGFINSTGSHMGTLGCIPRAPELRVLSPTTGRESVYKKKKKVSATNAPSNLLQVFVLFLLSSALSLFTKLLGVP